MTQFRVSQDYVERPRVYKSKEKHVLLIHVPISLSRKDT